ncbi:MAG: hypothetical protein ACW99A_04100 [Candidatus Kariarchaeaceae archaeon]|jgi:hypothetical protein
MKISNILLILFLASLVLLIPSARTEESYNLDPQEAKAIIVNVQTSKLIILSNSPEEIGFRYSYLNPEDGAEELIDSPFFQIELTIPIDKKGFYRLDFLSTRLATITIKTEGIPNTTIIIVSLTMLIAIAAQIQKQFSRSFDY